VANGQSVVAWSPWYLAYLVAFAVFSLLGGSILFHRLEFLFAEYV